MLTSENYHMKHFFKLLSYLFAFSSFDLPAEVHLNRLVEYDKKTCQQVLETASLTELWNYFLKGQAELFSSQEAEWLAQKECWTKAKTVLEIGSGNGAYLSLLADKFKDKTFLGIDKRESFVNQANDEFSRLGLSFVEGDAEIVQEHYHNQFDAILYRLTLQHLQNPKHALEIAHQYLKEEGYIVIIDSYDPARRSSHHFPLMEEASRQHNEQARLLQKGNRYITIEILAELQNKNSNLSALYEVVHTSLDAQGNRLEKGIRFESEQDRKRCFNHTLLFLTIMKKAYEVSVDLSKAYEELQICLEEENYWNCPGMHLLILKKI